MLLQTLSGADHGEFVNLLQNTTVREVIYVCVRDPDDDYEQMLIEVVLTQLEFLLSS